jgi:hypothetical protein
MDCAVVARYRNDVGPHDDSENILIGYSDSVVKRKLLTRGFKENSKAEVDAVFSCGARADDLRVCTQHT